MERDAVDKKRKITQDEVMLAFVDFCKDFGFYSYLI
jgi:hypothetical protein